MSRARSRLTRRLAVGIALAVSAGSLTTGLAHAAPAPDGDGGPAGDLAVALAAVRAAVAEAGGGPGARPLPPRLDLDGDGRDELLHRTAGAWHVLGSAAGSVPGQGYRVDPGTDDPRPVKDVVPVGDLDRDGTPDLAVLTTTGRLSLVPAEATGTGPARFSSEGWNRYNKLVGASDVTGDGVPDLLARTPAGALHLYRGTGAAAPAKPFGPRLVVSTTGWNRWDRLVGGGDFTGDGVADLVTRTPEGELWLHASTAAADPTALFAPAVRVDGEFRRYNRIGLLDDGGVPVLSAREGDGRLVLIPYQGGGRLGTPVPVGAGPLPADVIAGEGGNPAHGRSDLYARARGGSVDRFDARGDGDFLPSVEASDPWAFPHPDRRLYGTVATDGTAGSQLFVTDGADVREAARGRLVGAGWAERYDALAGPGDLTGDGFGDLVTRDAAGDLWLHRSGGSGFDFEAPVKAGTGFGRYGRLLGAGDVTGDGRADLLGLTPAGALWVHPGTGNAARPFGARAKVADGLAGYRLLASVGDVTGDGLGDLVGMDAGSGTVRLSATGLPGTAAFTSPVALAASLFPYADVH
ncbi:FG-GAP repeat domain-containing protein [Streptomyces sp. BI20]|uniref:FG-GAP repeat domain-containing protein n=1 Tax=Streptomyces sp. BI20 TaxID=3403460 RepID=UPI003C76565D